MKKRAILLIVGLLAACTAEDTQPLGEQRSIHIESKKPSAPLASDAFYPPAFTIEHVDVTKDDETEMALIRVDYLLTEELRKKLGRRDLFFSIDFTTDHQPRDWVKEHGRSSSQLNGQVTFEIALHELKGDTWKFYIGNEQKEILHIFHLES